MKISFLLLFSVFFSNLTFSAALMTPPEFEGYMEWKNEIQKIKTMNQTPERNEKIDSIRVSVFPHLGKYSVPQGRETVVDKITISSEGSCQWMEESTRGIIHQKSSFTVEAKDVVRMHRVSCSKPIKILREKSLPSYSYSGDLLMIQESFGARKVLRVIEETTVDEYLRGVIPSEMPSSWPVEALKAQAICARTYALEQIQTSRQNQAFENYDLDDTVMFQAYTGVTSYHPRTDKALEETKGLVMTYQQRPIIAWFSADAGGMTEVSKNVWGTSTPYTVAKKEIYDFRSAPKDWVKKMSLSSAEKNLKSRSLMPSGERLDLIRMNDQNRFESQRLISVTLKFKSGKSKEIKATDLRYALGLRSTLMSFSQSSGVLTFQGRGFGHGVGMSQTGAKLMTETLGSDFLEILHFYFEGIEISL